MEQTTSHLIARRRLFLEQDIWKTIPWALQGPSKSQQNLLVDMLVDIPGYLQDDNELQHSPDPIAHASLLARVKSTLYALYNWRYVRRPRFLRNPRQTIKSPTPVALSTSLEFRTLLSTHR
jgi:hypothetical protein